MKKTCQLLWTAILAGTFAAGLSGCNEMDDPVVEEPRARIAKGDATSSSVTFTVTPSDATECAYAYVKEGDDEPSAELILHGGGNR